MTTRVNVAIKPLLVVLLAFLASAALIVAAPAQQALAGTQAYKMGTTVSGTVDSAGVSSQVYTFTLSAPADVKATLSWKSGEGDSVYAKILNSKNETVGDILYADDYTKSTTKSYVLPKGSYKYQVYCMTTQSYIWSWDHAESYSAKLATITPKVTFSKKSGEFSVSKEKNVSFKYTCSQAFADKYLKIANSNKKVAKVTLSYSGGKGTLKVEPKKLGKTVVSVKLAGKVKAKYTIYVTKNVVYVAKGEKVSVPKPLGVKKVKYTSAKKAVASTTKAGKITGKKQGKTTVATKSGKITYKYTVIVTDYKKLGKEANHWIKEDVPDPNKYKINKMYKGFIKSTNGEVGKRPVVYVDFTFDNGAGGKDRSKIITYYDTSMDIQSRFVSNYKAVTYNRKAFSI